MEEVHKVCPRCGSTVTSDIKFCPNCGYDFTGSGNVPLAQHAPAPSGGVWNARDAILNTIAGRGATDEKLGTIWVIVPVLAWIISVAASIMAGFLGLIAGSLVRILALILTDILLAVLAYKLIKRQKEHMLREAQLRKATIDYLRTRGAEKGASNNIEQYLGAMDAVDREMTFNEKPRDPMLWVIFDHHPSHFDLRRIIRAVLPYKIHVRP